MYIYSILVSSASTTWTRCTCVKEKCNGSILTGINQTNMWVGTLPFITYYCSYVYTFRSPPLALKSFSLKAQTHSIAQHRTASHNVKCHNGRFVCAWKTLVGDHPNINLSCPQDWYMIELLDRDVYRYPAIWYDMMQSVLKREAWHIVSAGIPWQDQCRADVADHLCETWYFAAKRIEH